MVFAIKNSCIRSPEIIICLLYHGLYNTAHWTNLIPLDPMMHCINDNLLIERRKLLRRLAPGQWAKVTRRWNIKTKFHLNKPSGGIFLLFLSQVVRKQPMMKAGEFIFIRELSKLIRNKSHVTSREHTASIIFTSLDYLPIKTFP